MEYSAFTAGLTFGKVLFMAPFMVAGATVLAAAILRKARPVAGLVGILFLGTGSFVLTSDAMASLQCRAAASSNEGEWVTGTVSSVKHTFRRSGDSTLHFSVGQRELTSRSAGINNDCGFIESFGKVARLKEGQQVSVLIYQGHAVRVVAQNDG
jgi:hypothetical protein